ncbi:MAG: hypothetical protein GX109_05775 [Bacteroidales bacterium]|nr:hypothetical protein [Bacteroidales bacterium]
MSYKGGDRAEFGIIDDFDTNKDYGDSYEPERYHCVAIVDDALDDWWELLTEMNSHFHCFSRPSKALARWGITIIPPESLSLLIDIIRTETKEAFQEDASDIIVLLEEAKRKNKFVIHYGI